MVALTIFMAVHIRSIQRNIRESIEEFKGAPFELNSFEKLKPSSIYWAAHVNLVRYTRKIFKNIQQRKKQARKIKD